LYYLSERKKHEASEGFVDESPADNGEMLSITEPTGSPTKAA